MYHKWLQKWFHLDMDMVSVPLCIHSLCFFGNDLLWYHSMLLGSLWGTQQTHDLVWSITSWNPSSETALSLFCLLIFYILFQFLLRSCKLLRFMDCSTGKYLDGSFQILITNVVHLKAEFQLHHFSVFVLFEMHHPFPKTKPWCRTCDVAGCSSSSW